MIAFIQEFLPQIVAGLLPAIIVAGQSIHLLIKNIGIKKEISELNLIFKDVEQKNISASTAVEKSIPLLTNVFTEGLTEFKEIKDELVRIIKEELSKELSDFKAEITSQIKEQREMHQAQMLSIRGDKNEDAQVL